MSLDVILRTGPTRARSAKIEAKTLKYLAIHTKIPVPNVLQDRVDRAGWYFVMNERIDGQTLEEALPCVSEHQK